MAINFTHWKDLITFLVKLNYILSLSFSLFYTGLIINSQKHKNRSNEYANRATTSAGFYAKHKSAGKSKTRKLRYAFQSQRDCCMENWGRFNEELSTTVDCNILRKIGYIVDIIFNIMMMI